MNEMPEGNLSPKYDIGNAPPAKEKKKPRVSLIVGLAVAAAALLAAAALFLISYFSANSRFNRAMESGDFEAAEEMIESKKLKASEINDEYFLTLADHYLDDFKNDKSEYKDSVQKLIDLKSADIFDKSTYDKIEDCERTVIDGYVGKIYDSFCEKQIGYEDAAKQIKKCDVFDDGLAKDLIGEYASKAEEKREEFYADALAMITDRWNEYTPDEIIDALDSFGDYRNAKTLAGILGEIKEGNGVEAAKLLIDYEDMIEASEDVIDAEAPSSGLIDAMKSDILDGCFESGSSDSDGEKLDKKLKYSYTKALFGDDSDKKTTICGNESIRAFSLGKELDLDMFSGCKGGTGKVLYLAHYLSDSSYEPYDMFYYYRYEDLKDIPSSKMPESLEDVEYLIVYDEGGDFYSDYSTKDGDTVKVYQRTIQVTVRQYPTGKIIYDSGVLTGPTPPDSLTVSTGTKFAYGEDPDLSAVIAKVKETVGLE